MASVPEIRFAPARRGRIAYQCFGEGDATIVAIPPSAQNIEVAWEDERIAAMLRRFAGFSRYLHFDKLGTGSSDRSVPVAGLDERVDDLRDVMDHAGIDRAHLFGQSEGGPMTLLFAASYPDRVASVTLVGSYARLAPDPLSDELRAQITERQREFSQRWGTPESDMVDVFVPSLAADEEFRRWHQRYERLSATSDSLFNLLQLSVDVDVREVLPLIDVPVLVMHRRDDRVIPLEIGRAIADGVPGAQFIALDGDDHFSYAGDVEAWMSELERFVTGTVTTTPDRRLDTPPQITVRTLGRFAVVVDGEEVPTNAWGSRQARRLLKRLVVADGWPVTRDELCDLLWPGEDDAAKLSSRLSVQLSAVRRVLNGGVIADRQTVALDRSAIRSDIASLLALGDDAEMVDAYLGEFLPGDRGEPWADVTREQIRRRVIDAGHRLLRRAEGPDAEALVRRLLEIDPYDAASHQALIAILGDEGDQAGAARAEAAYRAAMAELGIEV
ncbi:MAG: alpha/beta fold hydrolase [Acidimicrobiales bacterium]